MGLSCQLLISLVYLLTGNINAAESSIETGIRLDPLSANQVFTKGWILYLNRQYSESVQTCKLALEKDPKMLPAYVILGCALAKNRAFKEVEEIFTGDNAQNIEYATRIGILGIAYTLSGDTAKAKSYADELKRISEEGESERALAFHFVMLAAAGENDLAIAWLSRAVDIKLPLILFLLKDPLIDPIIQDIRFQKIEEQVFGKLSLSENQTENAKHKPLVDDRQAKKWLNEIIHKVENEKIYLDPDLNLRKLAKLTAIHPNQLSYVLNRNLDKNFSEFLNQYRLQHFLQLVQTENGPDHTFIGLAYDSGFNSKTAFYNFFKKQTGLTPKQYLQQKSR